MKTLIIFACCNRKKSNGDKGLRWRRKDSVVSRLPLEARQRLLESRLKLSRRFKHSDGKDLGGDQDAPVPLLRAFERYDGNLYRRIENSYWQQLAEVDHVEILIVSALYGLLIPFEPIRNYNLMMNTSIAPRFRLSRWWVDQGLDALLKEYVIYNRISEVHDFLSGSYAIITKPLLRTSIKVHHKTYKGLGSGTDYHRGRDINNLLKSLLT